MAQRRAAVYSYRLPHLRCCGALHATIMLLTTDLGGVRLLSSRDVRRQAQRRWADHRLGDRCVSVQRPLKREERASHPLLRRRRGIGQLGCMGDICDWLNGWIHLSSTPPSQIRAHRVSPQVWPHRLTALHAGCSNSPRAVDQITQPTSSPASLRLCVPAQRTQRRVVCWLHLTVPVSRPTALTLCTLAG